jgi:type II secretory pathway pseudopilin PulG
MTTRPTRQSKQGAFTIIELLTVMSIIVILIGLLVPALNQVRRYALGVKQNAQFNAIRAALELFRTESGGEYPESGARDSANAPYCGAMKLCEAMMGQDLLGYHPQSRFLVSSSFDVTPPQLYRLLQTDVRFTSNLKERKGPYLETDKVSAHMLTDIYPAAGLGVFTGQSGQMFVLSDVYKRTANLGIGGESKVGMPVLYYRADLSGMKHDPNAPNATPLPTSISNNGYIYNNWDNQELLDLGMPGGGIHQLAGPNGSGLNFYSYITNPQITMANRPYKPDSYILISAGWDGEYGTKDDIADFQQK